ncbi:hypothetical protein ACFIOY_40200 [Bradyrhizobium sp. TZ2]
MHDPIDELATHALAQYAVIVQALFDAVQYRGSPRRWRVNA